MPTNCVLLPQKCTGCGICAVICPKSAIKISMNNDGFLEASANEKLCISCGRCITVCPKTIQNKGPIAQSPQNELYAAWSKNIEDRKSSASGGIATELAKWGMRNGYKAAGVIYDIALKQARTIIASSFSELELFKGSKYLQSYTVDAFETVLNTKSKYIVFGTPCQIAGLHKAAVLTNRRKDLILVDCFCHGVPSYLVWQAVCKDFFPAQKNWNKIIFRDKKGGWHNFLMTLHNNGKEIFTVKEHSNPFYKLFFSDLCMASSCYSCHAKKDFSFADIRLGDFWGKAFDLNEKGVSAIVICSEQGKQVLTSCYEEKQIELQPAQQAELTPFQSVFKQDRHIPQAREEIMTILRKRQSLTSILKKVKQCTSSGRKTRERVKAFLPVFLYKYVRYWMHR